MANNAINTDSEKRCAFVAPLFTAGYGERWAVINMTCTPLLPLSSAITRAFAMIKKLLPVLGITALIVPFQASASLVDNGDGLSMTPTST